MFFRFKHLYNFVSCQTTVLVIIFLGFLFDITGQNTSINYLEQAKSFVYIDLDSVKFYSNKGLSNYKAKDSIAFDLQMTLLDAYLVRQMLGKVDSIIGIIKKYPVDSVRKIKLLQRSGHHAFYSQDLPTAINYFIESSRLSENVNDAEGENTSNFNLATVYVAAGDRDKAEKYFTKSLNYFLEKKDSVKAGISYLNIGVLNSMNKENDKAIENLNRALIFIKNPVQKASVLHNLGVCNEEKGNIRKAIDYYENAIQLTTETGRSQYTLSKIFLNMATAHRKLKNYDQAELAIKNSIKFNAQPDSLLNVIAINDELSYIYNVKGKYKEAYDYLFTAYDSYKKYGHERNKEYADSITTIYEVEKQQLENEKLVVDVQLRNQTISTQRNILLGGGLGVLFITFLSVQLFRQSQKRHQLNVELKSQKDQIQLLNQELNHRVKNNLAFMTSLLEMQGRRSDSQEVKTALRESESRLKALALVHNQLFKSNSDTEVNLKNYLQEVTTHLKEIFFIKDKPIRFQTSFSDHQINAEDAMRLGLIVNELVTNSVKHAFVQVPDPLIIIETFIDPKGILALKYEDNGPHSNPQKDEKTEIESLGLKLIALLRHQLGEKYVVMV